MTPGLFLLGPIIIMINDEDDDIEQIDSSLVTEEDTLLFSTFPGPRIFILNNATQTNMLGVLIEETDDSFLVGLPSRLLEAEKGVQVEPFVQVPYLRLMKTSVSTILYLFGIFKDKYLSYLIEHGATLYPDIQDIIEDIKEQHATPVESVETSRKEDKTGMDDEALKEYLSEKLQRGEIIYGTGSKH